MVGGGGSEGLVWNADNQINDAAEVQALEGAVVDLNGHSEAFAKLTMARGSRLLVPRGGMLTVRELIVEGKSVPRGIYTFSAGWMQGRGYAIVGDVKRLPTSGAIDDPNKTIGAGNMAVLTAASTFKLAEGDCSVSAALGGFPLTLIARGQSRFSGVLTGTGSLRIESSAERSLELIGESSNSFTGATTLARGVLKLNKPANAYAIPGNLILGGSLPENDGDAVIWNSHGQLAESSTVTLQGTRPSCLDLNGHKSAFAKLLLSKAAVVRTGKGGTLEVKQLSVDGLRLKDGTYQAPQPWLQGTGAISGGRTSECQGGHWFAGDGDRCW